MGSEIHLAATGGDVTALESLKAEMEGAERAYFEAKRRYNEALCRAQPIKVGDVIRSSDGKLARVTHLHMLYGRPEIVAMLRNKDGSFGKRPTTMWRREWDKPEIVSCRLAEGPMDKPKIRAACVELWLDQIEQIEPMMRLVKEAADAGKPGLLCAQVFTSEMYVFFIDHDRALKFQELMGQEVGRTNREEEHQ